MSDEKEGLFWYTLKCKRCGEILKPKKGLDGLVSLEIMLFVSRHLVKCYDMFELTLKPKIADKG